MRDRKRHENRNCCFVGLRVGGPSQPHILNIPNILTETLIIQVVGGGL